MPSFLFRYVAPMKPAPAWIPLVVASPGFGGGGNIPRGPTASPGSVTDQICRNSTVPRGWIAVDYLSAQNCSPMSSRGELGPNAALLVRHQALPPETILTVCADQRVPTDWSRAPDAASDGTLGRCPRRRVDTRTGATTMQIRRMR